MKLIAGELAYFFSRMRERNIKILLQFIGLLAGLVAVYSVIFHFLMLREGQDHTWITGIYWTLTVMSTLGFGDITFHTDLGRIFSILVLLSGVILLLIMLPFTFIQFFYAPWLEAQAQGRVRRRLPDDIRGHVILTSFNPYSIQMIEQLVNHHIPYCIVSPEMQEVLDLGDQNYKAVLGGLGDPETYRSLKAERAALLVASSGDMLNTNIVSTVREVTQETPIVATAEVEESIDILQLAGATHVFQFKQMLGEALARKTVGIKIRDNIIGHIDTLLVAETPVMRTPLEGKRLADSRLRESTGLNIIGYWEKGRYVAPHPDTVLDAQKVLLLAGTESHFRRYDEQIAPRGQAQAPTLIIGGGRVGKAAADLLDRQGIPYRVVEKNPQLTREDPRYITGSAADIETLNKAGIEQAPSVIITTHNDHTNIYLTIYCRKLRPDIQIISRANTDRSVSKLHSAGADQVMSYSSFAANTSFNLLRPSGLQILAEGLNLFRSPASAQLIGKSLMDCKIRIRTACNLVGVSSNSAMHINPEPSFVFSRGDELILVGSDESQKKYHEIFPA